ncbi:CLUMA_CG003319, isoform A [Clunio marinus]|uniref:CLUMA_CG003319, isoform A n=1 Tax=Clunio marinus TaxID=568069 RepID=A0A1J1HPR6_9DIPT|nr:CLUMA_CG003319, isoform A [Clunio marinus]
MRHNKINYSPFVSSQVQQRSIINQWHMFDYSLECRKRENRLLKHNSSEKTNKQEAFIVVLEDALKQ